MRSTPSPQPIEFVEYLRAQHPSATEEAIAKSWRQVKEFFDSDAATFESIKDLMNVGEFIAAFKDTPYVQLPKSTVAARIPLPFYARPSSSALTRSSRTRSSGSNGSSNSSGSTLNAIGLAKMQEEFLKHYSAFKGEPWTLASGVVVDQVIAESVKTLTYESALHSFIIEDADAIMDVFPNESDRIEVQEAMEQQSERRMATLSPEELHYLTLYDKPMSEIDDLLACGWANMPISGAYTLPDKGFRRLVHHCIQHLYFIYRKENFLLPREQSEAWYVNKLWSIVSIIFDNGAEIGHQPGETSSQASALRKNKRRSFDDRQLQGRKADGLIIASDTRLELCIIEAARKDAGATSTKALSDTRKMAKSMKDMHDLIRARSAQSIRDKLRTYGMRISGPSITFYSLRQYQGRMYQLCAESTVVFPAQWRDITTTNILSVLAKLFAFKKELSRTADQVTEATKLPLTTLIQGNGDFWAATLTTPTNSPRLAPLV
ncbi:hypothetical protein BGW38_001134 [Lunasporangiospora selenospora]|uniref:Uncharacterized protein n=1 Tax=Lunasporangiospora selenospora TaxID=979761 RepID=A0A9P6KDQ9_9FUNG|nr:hypothetical protein BGW38_001134 [Lunasporangiospora selenospora]